MSEVEDTESQASSGNPTMVSDEICEVENRNDNVSNKSQSVEIEIRHQDNSSLGNNPTMSPSSVASDTVPKVGSQTNKATHISAEQQLTKSKKDLESMVIKYARSESENLQNKSKIDDLDKKLKRAIKDNESLANRIRILTNDKNSISEKLNAKLAQLTVLEQKNSSLSNVQTGQVKELEAKCIDLEKANEELLKQIDTYKSKEGELLDFSERLSMKQLLLQTELSKALEDKPDYKVQYEQLRTETNRLAEQNRNHMDKIEQLTDEFAQVKQENTQFIEEKSALEVNYRRRIDELENEMKVMRRKHQIAAKEIYKQLKQRDTTNTQQAIKS